MEAIQKVLAPGHPERQHGMEQGQDGMLGDPGSVFRSERAAAEKKGKKGRERGVQRPQYSP